MSIELNIKSGAEIKGGLEVDSIDIFNSKNPPIKPGAVRLVVINNSLMATTDGVTFTMLGGPLPAKGLALTGASTPQTVNPASDSASIYVLQNALAQNATLVLGVSGSPITDHVVSVWKIGGGAFTYTVEDDTTATLFTFASNSTKQVANFYFNGTHYVFLSMQYTA